MAYNVPTNGIEAGFLYKNIGTKDVVYNSNTYTTGQTFYGVLGVASFSYSGSGTEEVNEVTNLQASDIEFVNVDSDRLPDDITTVIKSADVGLLLNDDEKVFNDPTILRSSEIEYEYISQPSAYIRTRRGIIKNAVINTPPPRIAYFGDSWTANPIGYPFIVNGLNGIDYTNYGVSGTTVYAGASGTFGVPGSNLSDKYMTEITLGYTGQYTSFMYGTNDLGILDATWKSTYKGIVQDFITAGWPPEKLIIMIPGKQLQPLDPRITNYITEIANELGINLYDVNQRFLDTGRNYDLFGSDEHPNTDGMNVIATGYDTFIKR